MRAGRTPRDLDRGRLPARDRDDHRRERHHPADGVHPLRARDRPASRDSPSPSASARSSRCSPRSSSPRRSSGIFGRGRLLPRRARSGRARSGCAGTSTSSALSRWFFSFSGVILIVGALSLAGNQLNFGIDFESGHPAQVRARARPSTSSRCATVLETPGARRRRDPGGRRRGLRRRLPDPERASCSRAASTRCAARDRLGVRDPARELREHERRARPSASRWRAAPPARSSSRCC